MKFQISSPQQALALLKQLVFHPMLYLAIGLHWALLNTPLPPQKAKEIPPEELLEESVTIAKANSLQQLVSKPKKQSAIAPNPKPNPKPKVKPKAKPNPVVQALKSQLKPAQPQPPAAPTTPPEDKPKPPEDKPDAPKEPANPSPEDPNTSETQETTEDTSGISERLKAFAQEENPFAGSEAEQQVAFDPGLLPQPNLVFTDESLKDYHESQGELQSRENIITVQRWIQAPLDRAIARLHTKYQAYEIHELGDYGGGLLYELKQGQERIYISLFQPTKRTQKSTTIFVVWTGNPQSSQ